MKETAVLGMVGGGIVLLALSAVWGLVFPASNSWTEEKAQRMTELTDKTHTLLFRAAAEKERPESATPGEAQKAYQESKAELDALRNEFESRRDRPNTVARYFRWIGIALVVVGGIGVMVGKSG